MKEDCNNCMHVSIVNAEKVCVNLRSPFSGEEIEYCDKCAEYAKKDFMNPPEVENAAR